MKRLLLLLLLYAGFSAFAQRAFRIICTSDVHGNYLPYETSARRAGTGSLARVHSYVEQQRGKFGEDYVLLLDAGDLLQGSPASYYYNYVDTLSAHLCSRIMNRMGYDALTVGNHDIETGHRVYDRWTATCQFPVLAANVVDSTTGKPYWKPYAIIEKGGVRFAVLGLLTPIVPQWVPTESWRGLGFEDMETTARRYMPEIRAQADVVIGLFHSGLGDIPSTDSLTENAALAVAQRVPGFDLILYGHDHQRGSTSLVNAEGDTVCLLNPGAGAQYVAVATCTPRFAGQRARVTDAGLVDVRHTAVSAALLDEFEVDCQTLTRFTQEVLGRNRRPLSMQPAFFGSSALVDYIHTQQLRLTGADISFAAPLDFDTTIPQGNIRMSDLFQLYKYENRLYTLRLTGQEIKDYLEYSYAGWVQTIRSGRKQVPQRNRRMSVREAGQHLLALKRPLPKNVGNERWKLLATPSYNFDSAAGLFYTVDVTRPVGQRVTIYALAPLQKCGGVHPFDLRATYSVAMNSYRASGGGGHLTRGAGIPADSIQGRIVWRSERDMRHYLAEEIRRQGFIDARPLRQWRFVPDDLVREAIRRDARLLFPRTKVEHRRSDR